jgi:hypothetical protein
MTQEELRGWATLTRQAPVEFDEKRCQDQSYRNELGSYYSRGTMSPGAGR